MLLAIGYESKKAMKAAIGQPLSYQETSMFGPEYKSNGVLTIAHRPYITSGKGREFFANVTMKNGKIEKVE